MTTSTHYRDRIVELMGDGKPRTVREINDFLGCKMSSYVHNVILELERDETIERLDRVGQGQMKAHLFRKTVQRAPLPDGPSDCPFHWQTYVPYKCEALAKSTQL